MKAPKRTPLDGKLLFLLSSLGLGTLLAFGLSACKEGSEASSSSSASSSSVSSSESSSCSFSLEESSLSSSSSEVLSSSEESLPEPLGPIEEAPYAESSDFTLDYFEEVQGYVIGDYLGSLSDFKIPDNASVEGEEHPIVAISDNAFYGRNKLRRVILGENIVSIGNDAFYGSGLEELYVTSSLFHVGSDAFDKTELALSSIGGVFYLPSIENPNCVAFGHDKANIAIQQECEAIADGCFDDITKPIPYPVNVKTIGDVGWEWDYSNLSAESEMHFKHLGDNALRGCDKISSLFVEDSGLEIGEHALKGAENLKSVTLGERLFRIEEGAFSDCHVLTQVTLPSSLQEIGKGAFAQDRALPSIVFPSSLSKVGDSAFSGCALLGGITWGEGLKTIGVEAFEGCAALSSFIAPSMLTEIGTRAFEGCSALGEMSLNDGLRSIGEQAFLNCASLKEVSVPLSATAVSKGVFEGCNKLTTLALPNIESFLGYYFGAEEANKQNDSIPQSLRKVVLSDNIETIPASAFAGCSNIEEIQIPDTVKEIEASAFAACTNLSSISLPKGLIKCRRPNPFIRFCPNVGIQIDRSLRGPFLVPRTADLLVANLSLLELPSDLL